MNSKYKDEYIRRINLAQDYIEKNIGNQLSLEEISNIGGFSKYHFHRIYKGITGETLNDFINRIKMEQIAFNMINREDLSITDIAYHFGYTDSSIFSRAFKNYYNISPSEFRKLKDKDIKISKKSKVLPVKIVDNINKYNLGGNKMDVNFTKEELKNMEVIYIRFTGSYEGLGENMPIILGKLFDFAMKNNLLVEGETKVLSIYHDNPNVTEDNLLRTSIGLTIPENRKFELENEIGLMEISGVFGIGHFNVYTSELGDAWNYMYSEYLPNSGYTPRNAFPFEVYVDDTRKNSMGKNKVDIYIPIEPLGIM